MKMGEKRKRDTLPPPRPGSGVWGWIVEQIRLSWALLLDNRVPILLKIIPIAAVAYCFSPISLILWAIPVLGQLDDIAVLAIGILLFNEFAPREVAAEHLVRFRQVMMDKPPDDEKVTVIDIQPKVTVESEEEAVENLKVDEDEENPVYQNHSSKKTNSHRAG